MKINSHELPDPEYRKDAEKTREEGIQAKMRLFSLGIANSVVDIVAAADSADKLTMARDRLADNLYDYLTRK